MKKICYFLDGRLINIGEWDYQRVPEVVIPAFVVPEVTDPEGKVLAKARTLREEIHVPEVVGNPLPNGATSEEREVVEFEHGWCLADDHERLRRAEYPPIGDQLDALWKIVAGAALPVPEESATIADAIETVKAKYPKK